MKQKKLLFALLVTIILGYSYCLERGTTVNTELCVVNDNYNPNFAEDYNNASTGVKIAWGSMEAVIGFGIGMINPALGLAYAL